MTRPCRAAAAAFAALVFLAPSLAMSADNWGQRISSALGKSGTEMPGGVYRVGLPRTDLTVMLDGVQLKPALALGSWLAFQNHDGQATVMGDLVLTEEEIGPVMQKLEAGGIKITALHNHLLRARPMTFYLHVLGEGDPEKLAATLHDALAESKTPLGSVSPSGVSSQPPSGGNQAQPIDLDTAMIDRVLVHKGKVTGGVYQVSIPRAEPVKEGGMDVPASMGSAIALNFQPTGQGKMATTGDFVLTSEEVNPVIQALTQNGIEVTAIHNHMLDDQPRLFFMHFWANGDAGKIAQGLKAALGKVSISRS